MRDIRFRAFHKATKTMHEAIVSPWHVRDLWKDEVEVMQFTGALDMDGKELWEGDIVSFWPNEMAKNMAIIWNAGKQVGQTLGFILSASGVNESLSVDANNRVWYVRKVGNIYENPEYGFF